MRSRYTAYAMGAVDYLLNTTHPSGPQYRSDTEAWRIDVRRFCETTEFVKLTVHSASVTSPQGEVHFSAHIVQGGTPSVLEERSLFVKHNGRWFYHSALPLL